MKNLNNAYKEAKKTTLVFYNLNHEYQPRLDEIMKCELLEETAWTEYPTEYEFRKELATFVLNNSELLANSNCYLGIHYKKANVDLFSFSIEEENTTLDQFLYSIDYEQLKQDKLEYLTHFKMESGLLYLIDAIQDLACLRGIRPEKDIFLIEEE